VSDPIENVWRAQREAAARFTESWRGMLTGPAGAPTKPASDAGGDASPDAGGNAAPDASPAVPAGPTVEERFQALTDSVNDYAATLVQPLHHLVDSQRDFADRMARWAELQRDFADDMASWAARQREHVDHLDRLLAPFLPAPDPAEDEPPIDNE
jgi:hypothetical protein